MNKSILLIAITNFILLPSIYTRAQKPMPLNGIRDTLKEIQKTESALDKDFERQSALTDKTFSAMSTQLTLASYVLVFFTVILTIFGFIFGSYVSRIANRVSEMETTVRDLLNQTRGIQKEVEKTDSQIQNNIKSIYERLKKEETDSFLERLVMQPRDIANLCPLLLSRELSKDNFKELKSIFLKIVGKPEYVNEEFGYKLLLFQHFSKESIQSDDIRDLFFKDLAPLINNAFENDIIKSTKDIFSALSDITAPYFKKIANEFFQGIQNSKYKDDSSVLDAIISTLNSETKAIATYLALIGNEALLDSKISFGRKIINQYQLSPANPDLVTIQRDIANTLDQIALLSIRPYFVPLFSGAQVQIIGNRGNIIVTNVGQIANNLTFQSEDAGISLVPTNIPSSANRATNNITINFNAAPPNIDVINLRILATFSDVQNHPYSQEIICTNGVLTTTTPRLTNQQP